jgi:hypothetical protein
MQKRPGIFIPDLFILGISERLSHDNLYVATVR